MNFIRSYITTGCVLFLMLFNAGAQSIIIKGKVTEAGADGKVLPVPGAVIQYHDSVNENTDADGLFSLATDGRFPLTVIAFMTGYESDTLIWKDDSFKEIRLRHTVELKEVEIKGRQDGLAYSTIRTLNVEKVTEKEILKAACCNLSEAFETSPTVNVAYTDAVTGAKEIRLLGLSGIYAQLLTEGIPNFRGIAGSYGLYFIPGPWMESIQITKGSGSVQQGYEVTTGQINVEFKKPYEEEVPKCYINLFGEQNGNMEINLSGRKQLNDNWSAILMLHGNYMNGNQDLQKDGFLDIPHARQLNMYNRWHYSNHSRLESQIGCRFIVDERSGGQYEKPANKLLRQFTSDVKNRRAEVFGKFGILYPGSPGKSIGNIFQFTLHELNSRFGDRIYNADQKTVYLQSIYQNKIGSNHEIKFGVNYRYDQWQEKLDSSSRLITESVPGLFSEFTLNHNEKWTIVTGGRLDYHNLYNWIVTPRVHFRYNFTPMVVARISAGNSFRVPNLYADNIGVLASSRTMVVEQHIRPERAWNFGCNITGKFELWGREGSVNTDFYHTLFTNQLVVDRVSAVDKVYFYNLTGKSYASSAQATINYELITHLDIRIAYKMDDVRITYHDVLQRKPLVPKDRALVNVGYKTNNEHWRFDYTLVREGTKRLLPVYPDPLIEGDKNNSPVFFTMNLQVTKVFRKFELYGGTENLLNYYQQHPIVNANNPFGGSFDAGNIWGPVDGRRIYAGFRMAFN